MINVLYVYTLHTLPVMEMYSTRVCTKWLFVSIHGEHYSSRVSTLLSKTVTLLFASHDPRVRWLAELAVNAILTDWSSMGYTPINNSNYQWATLWTLQTEVNKHNRSCESPEGFGWEESVSLLKALSSHCRSLERSQSLCLIIMLTQLVRQSLPIQRSNRINENPVNSCDLLCICDLPFAVVLRSKISLNFLFLRWRLRSALWYQFKKLCIIKPVKYKPFYVSYGSQ